jgi:outer membrane protein assembly factor BamA
LSSVDNNIVKWLALVIVTSVFFSCSPTRYLKKDELLLKKNKIKGNEKLTSGELKSLLLQTPNRKFLVFPLYEWLYHTGEKHYDTSKVKRKRAYVLEKIDQKIEAAEDKPGKVGRLTSRRNKKSDKYGRILDEGNLLMRWGDPAVVFDSSKAQQSEANLGNYLRSKGFFESRTSFKASVKRKKVTTTYRIEEGRPHVIDTFYYNTHEDSTIFGLISSNSRKRKIRLGDNYDEAEIEKEIAAITDILKDNGFYDFSQQYIVANVDTAWGNYGTAIEIEIRKPGPKQKHRRFQLDSVFFITDAHIKNISFPRQSRIYNKVIYRFYDDKYTKKLLDRRVFIYPGAYYSKSNTRETQRQIANLDIFKFININYDTTGNHFIANIFTSPLPRFTTSNELGVNVSQGLPGPFFKFSLRTRNTFQRLDILDLSVGATWEGLPSATDEGRIYGNREINTSAALTFPNFLIPFVNLSRPSATYNNPKTRIRFVYTFTNRPEYTRNNINGTFGYSWENRRNTLFNFTLADISFINTTNVSADFQQRLEELEEAGNLLINSFRPSYVSAISFSATINRNDYSSYRETSSYNRILIESGGTLANLTGTEYLDERGLENYQFIKINNDFRQHFALSQYNTLALRLNIGFAYSYGANGVLPYERYFFAGGSNSIRAWRPRRLGPGSFLPLDSLGFYSDDVEQNGDILIEGSIEFRRNLFGFINGAIFLDYGNSWTYFRDNARPGAQFEWKDFYREIAVGTGAGIRFDFSFLIVRFDVGIKVYDPAREAGKRFLWNPEFRSGPFINEGPVVYNIGIGYPF